MSYKNVLTKAAYLEDYCVSKYNPPHTEHPHAIEHS